MPVLSLCAAIAMAPATTAPDWLHLLPHGEARTRDGRGPYRVMDPAVMMAASMADGKLVLDENHATDLAAPLGLSAPARGWIMQLQHRSDGIWGRVDWTAEALRLGVWRQYRGVSPAISHQADGTVSAILRASLTNVPNITGLTALHAEEAEISRLRNLDPRKLAEKASIYQRERADAGAVINYAEAVNDVLKQVMHGDR